MKQLLKQYAGGLILLALLTALIGACLWSSRPVRLSSRLIGLEEGSHSETLGAQGSVGDNKSSRQRRSCQHRREEGRLLFPEADSPWPESTRGADNTA